MNDLTIKNKIHTIREKQVMLDSDLAQLYQISTKKLNQAVKRNLERFPEDFMFQLTKKEYDVYILRIKKSNDNLKSQIVTSSWGGKRKLPYVFTEQGVAMLSGILRSNIAIKVNIQIMRAFIEMRYFLQYNSEIFSRLDKTEKKLLIYDHKFEEVFNLIQEKNIKPEKGIFFEGQIFESYKFINDLINLAKQRIILIDNYIDESVLILFSKKNVKINIYTNKINKKLELDFKKYKEQFNNIEIKEFKDSHDRFLIIDDGIYHFGASLKDLGKKWFGFSKFEDKFILEKILEKLNLKAR